MYYLIIHQCSQALKNLEVWLDKARYNDLAIACDMRTSARDNFMRPVHS